ncbi:MAG TPA: hypothetical protein VFU82_01800 [Gammaproteobacteria bacterium]|nr:hypothetical protein [Gammaproteobacteria bacterium]
MNHDDIQTLLITQIEAASLANEPGEEPLFQVFENQHERIIQYLTSKEKPRLTPIDLFRKITPNERLLVKYFLLLLVIEHPERFQNISNECLFMRLLNTQRNAYQTAAPGKTKSSRHFKWLMDANANANQTLNTVKFRPLITYPETKKPDEAADFIFDRAMTLLKQSKRNQGYRTLQFLIHLHDEQRLANDEPTLALLSNAFIHLASHAMTAYHETASPDLLTAHLNHLVRADFLSPKQDMANTINCLKNPGTQTAISQHPKAYLLFSMLYHLLPPSQQRPILLTWLANPALFNKNLLEIDLQTNLLSTTHPCDINHTRAYTPLTQRCIDYLSAENDDDRNQAKQNIDEQASPEARCLRLQIQLMEHDADLSVDLQDLGDSDTAYRLQATLNHRALKRTRREIHRLKAIDKKDPRLETHQALHDSLQNAVITILKLLINAQNTPTLSQIKSMVSLLLNLPKHTEAFDLACRLLTREDVLAFYDGHPEYLSISGNLCKENENKYAYLTRAIHLRPFHAPYYHDYASLSENNRDLISEKKADIQYLKMASRHIYPNEASTDKHSMQFVSMVFSKNLSWLHRHLPDDAGQLHRGALTHWQRLYHKYGQLPHNEIVAHMKVFYKGYIYETFQTLAAGWPDDKKPLRFEALLTLANTLKQWRCYKVIFLTPELLAEKKDKEIFALIKALQPNRHLLTCALKEARNPTSVLYKKLSNYQASLITLEKSLTEKRTSVTELSLFQPFNEENKAAPDNAAEQQNRL